MRGGRLNRRRASKKGKDMNGSKMVNQKSSQWRHQRCKRKSSQMKSESAGWNVKLSGLTKMAEAKTKKNGPTMMMTGRTMIIMKTGTDESESAKSSLPGG